MAHARVGGEEADVGVHLGGDWVVIARAQMAIGTEAIRLTADHE